MSDEPSCSNDLDPQLPRCAWLLACSVSRKDASPQSSASARRIPGRILSGNGVHRFRNHCSISPEYAGTYQLRLADAHLPGCELAEAMKLVGIDGSSLALHQGQTLIANCANAAMVIASMLERLASREIDKGDMDD